MARSGWSVIEQTVVQRERWSGMYGVKCAPLVYPGQVVLPDQPVLRLPPIIRPDLLVDCTTLKLFRLACLDVW